jgi:outer membrane protein TolC
MILARESIILYGESVKALEENFRIVTVGYNKGTFSRLDFLRARVALSNEKIKLINAENSYLTLKATMNIHLGRDINESLDVDPASIYTAAEENPLLSQAAEDETKMIMDMVSEATKNRPELIQITLKKQIENHSASAAESVYLWPSFFINGTYGMIKSIPADRGSDNQTIPTGMTPDEIYKYQIMQELASYMNRSFSPTGWNESWNITFGATYKWGALMPYDSAHAKSDQLKSKEKQTDYQIEDFIRSVRLDVQMGYLKLKSAANSISSQKGNIEAAEESVKVAIIQFRSGIIDNSKMLEANVQLSTAKTLYVQALHDYKSALAELNRAIGKDYFKIK